MCRIAAYLGRPIPLSGLFDEPVHGLTDQGQNARLMTDSSVAGDGWGVAWFPEEFDHELEAGPSPGLLKNILPIWSDQNARTALPAIRSRSFVGHIRLASPNVETCLTNTPIYLFDDHIWTVNGSLEPWPGTLSRAIRDRLDPDHEADVRGSTDAELVAPLWRTHFRRTGGRDRSGALLSALREARDLAFEIGGHIKMNVILAAPTELIALRYADPGEPNSLFILAGESARWSGGTVIASEPLDDGDDWREVAPSTLVRVTSLGVHTEPVEPTRVPSRQAG